MENCFRFDSRMKMPNDILFWIILIIAFLVTTVLVTVIRVSIYKQYGVPLYSAYPMYPVRL